jgi:hypothetical protein
LRLYSFMQRAFSNLAMRDNPPLSFDSQRLVCYRNTIVYRVNCRQKKLKNMQGKFEGRRDGHGNEDRLF